MAGSRSPWRAASKRVSGGVTRRPPSPDRGNARSSNPRLREINDDWQKEVHIDYPVGHPRRRSEALPLVELKFRRSVEAFLPRKRHDAVLEACGSLARLQRLPFHHFMDLFAA